MGASSQGGDWEALTLLFVIPSGGFAFVRYLTYRYAYETNELVVREGLIFRKERHIPYGRIQNIDAVERPASDPRRRRSPRAHRRRRGA